MPAAKGICACAVWTRVRIPKNQTIQVIGNQVDSVAYGNVMILDNPHLFGRAFLKKFFVTLQSSQLVFPDQLVLFGF